MLTPRLNCIINYVNSAVAADIGTDHAYIPIELIRSGRARRVIASDVKKGPLEIAEGNIKKYGLSDKIETRLGSGISVLDRSEADTVIIAGMGGELICEILKADIDKARESTLIIQPMNAQYELRRFLIENGFTIEKEDIENEKHRVYNIMIIKNGEQKPFDKDIDYHIPVYLYSHPKFKLLYEKKLREFNKIIAGLEKSENCDIERLNYYKNCVKEMEEIKNGL
ncbi:MAG: SAM-dependent methyltransferase [Oscillospiraceae bacterium]|nr:SAM-dependent methyltransferase [Oscillospiraceae bacterium]